MSRRPLTLLLVLLSALALGACGNREDGPTTEGETEGIYVEVGGLKYQVQVSRQLNPLDRADQAYLQGLPPEVSRLGPDEEYFAVFLRVENETGQPRLSAQDFQIRDTQENIYTPLPYAPEIDLNFFYYQPEVVGPNDIVPHQDTAAGERSPNGSVLLFKLRRFSLDNRPLELIIAGREVPQIRGTVNLDV